MHLAQVQAVGGDECGRVEDDVVSQLVGQLDGAEGVLHPREIGLGGHSEQVGLRLIPVLEIGTQVRTAEAVRIQGDVGDVRALAPGELADALHRVVIISHQAEVAARLERITLPDQLQCSAGIGGENDRVLIGIGPEIAQYILSGLLHEMGRGQGGGVLGVGIAQHRVAEKGRVLPHQPIGIEPPARVVEIHMPLLVQSAILPLTQLAQREKAVALGKASSEIRERIDAFRHDSLLLSVLHHPTRPSSQR